MIRPDELEFRAVHSSEIPKLTELSKKTFVEAFAHQNKESDMEIYVRKAFDKAKIEKEYHHQDTTFYFVLFNQQVIAYLKLNKGKAQSEYFGKDHMEIERIYVLQKFQGNKIGQYMINKSLEIARLNQLKKVWLGVWEKNTKAIKFYESHGFRPFNHHQFLLGKDLQTDVLMIRSVDQ